jgi:hypothetical protein
VPTCNTKPLKTLVRTPATAEVGLTAALGALSRQYQSFAVENRLAKKASDARLLVSSVSPGSIDISLFPDLTAYLAAAPMLALIEKAELVAKFGKKIKELLEFFAKSKEGKKLSGDNGARRHGRDGSVQQAMANVPAKV